MFMGVTVAQTQMEAQHVEDRAAFEVIQEKEEFLVERVVIPF